MTRAGGWDVDVANILSAYEIHFKIKVEEVNAKFHYLHFCQRKDLLATIYYIFRSEIDFNQPYLDFSRSI